MKIYNPLKIKKLLEMVEKSLTEEEILIIKEILSSYNKLFIALKEKIEYINRTKKTYLKESDDNEKLIKNNQNLEKKVNLLKRQNQVQREKLKINLKDLKKKDKIIEEISLNFQRICVTPHLAKYYWRRICKGNNDLSKCKGKLCDECVKEYFTQTVERKI